MQVLSYLYCRAECVSTDGAPFRHGRAFCFKGDALMRTFAMVSGAIAALTLLACGVCHGGVVEMEWVYVGDVGNAPDVASPSRNLVEQHQGRH